jgi:hypothetical protein
MLKLQNTCEEYMKTKQNSTEVETIYSSTQAAPLLNMGADNLRLLARTHRIGCRKIGRKFYFSAQNLNDYLAGMPQPIKQ